jgi:hypothetical protein
MDTTGSYVLPMLLSEMIAFFHTKGPYDVA